MGITLHYLAFASCTGSLRSFLVLFHLLTLDIQFSDWCPDTSSIPASLGSIKHPLEDKHGFSDLKAGVARRVQYIVPLTNPLGPKQTHCLIVQKVAKMGKG